MLRLERENARLQKSSADEESTQLVQGMLDDANVRKNELETEVRSVEVMSYKYRSQQVNTGDVSAYYASEYFGFLYLGMREY